MESFVIVNGVATPKTLVVASANLIKELVSASSVMDALDSINWLAARFKQDFPMAACSFKLVAID
jgi:hypothetical protein